MAEEFANFMQEAKKAPLEEKLNTFGDIVERMMSMILTPVIAAPSAPASAPPPSAGPPGGPPGGPPPPPGGPGGVRPASPVSLRGAIMGELKQLFSKRAQSG